MTCDWSIPSGDNRGALEYNHEKEDNSFHSKESQSEVTAETNPFLGDKDPEEEQKYGYFWEDLDEDIVELADVE